MLPVYRCVVYSNSVLQYHARPALCIDGVHAVQIRAEQEIVHGCTLFDFLVACLGKAHGLPLAMGLPLHVPRLCSRILPWYLQWNLTAYPAAMSTARLLGKTHGKIRGGNTQGKNHVNVQGKTPTRHPVPIDWYFDPAVGPSYFWHSAPTHKVQKYTNPSAGVAGGPPGILFLLDLAVVSATGLVAGVLQRASPRALP